MHRVRCRCNEECNSQLCALPRPVRLRIARACVHRGRWRTRTTHKRMRDNETICCLQWATGKSARERDRNSRSLAAAVRCVQFIYVCARSRACACLYDRVDYDRATSTLQTYARTHIHAAAANLTVRRPVRCVCIRSLFQCACVRVVRARTVRARDFGGGGVYGVKITGLVNHRDHDHWNASHHTPHAVSSPEIAANVWPTCGRRPQHKSTLRVRATLQHTEPGQSGRKTAHRAESRKQFYNRMHSSTGCHTGDRARV